MNGRFTAEEPFESLSEFGAEDGIDDGIERGVEIAQPEENADHNVVKDVVWVERH